MKSSYRRICISSMLLILLAAVPAFAQIPSNLIPAKATIIGTVNVPQVLALPVFASMKSEITKVETEAGISFSSLGVLPWFAIAHGSSDPAAAAFVRNLPANVLSRGKQSTYNGITLYIFSDDDDSVATQIDGWAVIGNLEGVKAVIDAKKTGKTLASTGKTASFTELAAKSSGMLTISWVPSTKDLRTLKATMAQTQDLTPFIDAFKGISFGIDHVGQNLVLKLAALSSANSVATAANTITMLKAGYQQQFNTMLNMYAAQLPAGLGQQIRQTWDSVAFRAEGTALVMTAAMPISLLEMIANQIAAMTDNSDTEDDD